MSSRELLRVTIRTLAPPAVIIFIFYKFYQQIKDIPAIKNALLTWRTFISVIFKSDEECEEED